MKKYFFSIISGVVFLFSLFMFDLDLFADEPNFNYPTAGVTIQAYGNKPGNGYITDYEFESIYPIIFIQESSNGPAYPYTPVAYGRYRSRYYTEGSTPSAFGNWQTIQWQQTSQTIDGVEKSLYRASLGIYISSSSDFSNVVIFNSFESGDNYFADPEDPDNLDNLVDNIGKDVLEDSLIPDIDWGSNGSPLDYDGSPDTYNIPAPQFNISYDANGNVIHSITFINFEYDSRIQDGKYGLVMSASWGTFDDFSLTHTGSLFDTTYEVTYGVNISDRPVFDIYDVPEKVTDIQYCPQSLNFNQNTISLNEFNNMINMNPVNSRTVNVPASEPNDILENQFKDFLARPQCPYNYLVFSCYYYKPNADGTYSFGPTTTGAFYPPNQGAIYNAGRFNGQDGNMQPGSGGGAGGNGGNWNNNWGNGNSNINLDYGSNVDPSQLVNNMNSLLGFIGNVPNFVTQLFSFLPEWLIIFIAVSIGLMVAIGVVKLFLG